LLLEVLTDAFSGVARKFVRAICKFNCVILVWNFEQEKFIYVIYSFGIEQVAFLLMIIRVDITQ
jgi:hypothetical protein